MVVANPPELPSEVANLPELPAEILRRIFSFAAAQGGFVGARRLMGGAICKAANEGWGQ